jgi:hypothetical protein
MRLKTVSSSRQPILTVPVGGGRAVAPRQSKRGIWCCIPSFLWILNTKLPRPDHQAQQFLGLKPGNGIMKPKAFAINLDLAWQRCRQSRNPPQVPIPAWYAFPEASPLHQLVALDGCETHIPHPSSLIPHPGLVGRAPAAMAARVGASDGKEERGCSHKGNCIFGS